MRTRLTVTGCSAAGDGAAGDRSQLLMPARAITNSAPRAHHVAVSYLSRQPTRIEPQRLVNTIRALSETHAWNRTVAAC